MFYVYILKSLKDNKRYIGSTNDIKRRLEQHNKGLVKSTKGRRPMVLLHFERFECETEARAKEHFYKTHKGYNLLKQLL